ncbi:hypothetical protein DMB66_32645 [Actinoplanes sp. ATCC 53533]|nr:hypothetical protein DMB66_32645 [Actinoplanes sp. ATCC 53533]
MRDVGDHRRVSDARSHVELQIDDVRNSQWTEATVTVRNLGNPVRRGARFHRASDSADLIDLELTRIVWYQRTVDEIPAGHTALVTLRGSGARVLRPGTMADGWQRIEGHNGPSLGAAG